MIESFGQRRTVSAKPSDTNAATIYTNSSVTLATLLGINIASTGSASATVWWNDGSTDWLLLDAYAVPANTAVHFEFANVVARDGESFKVKTSSANNLTFIAVIAEEVRL